MDNQKIIGIYLSRILSGFFVFFYKEQKYKLIYPNINLKYEAEIYSSNEYENNKFNDWVNEEFILNYLISMGLWTRDGDIQLKNIEKQIENLKIDLYNNVLNPNNIKKVKKNLESTKKTHTRLLNLRHCLDQYTPEGYSELLKNHFILVNSIYDNNNQLVFSEKLDEIDYRKFEQMCAIVAENTIDIPLYRTIARNELWKNYWSSNSDYLFDKPTVNWTDEQKTLVVLTKMYDNAYQHPECPPDMVFEDDDMFDGWMLYQRKENEKNKNKQKTEKMLQNKKLNNAGEIFIKANSNAEAENIYNLNDLTEQHIIKERNNIILSSNNPVEASNLPDTRREIFNMMRNQKKR